MAARVAAARERERIHDGKEITDSFSDLQTATTG